MRFIEWTDRIRDCYAALADRIRDRKEAILRIAVVVVIAAAMGTIMVIGIAPSKGEMAEIDDSLATLSTKVDSILALGPLAMQGQIDTLSDQEHNNHAMIGGLQTRLGNMENLITAVQGDLATVTCSPPEGYLTGTAGNYTLHTKAGRTGNFTANVHLVYSPPIGAGNATTQAKALQVFYSSINWTAPSLRDYICTLAYNGTAWEISQVSFNIGMFALAANTEETVDIKFGGLNISYEPTFAYVEVYRVLW